MEALLRKVRKASHIQIVWKGLWGFRLLSRYSIFDLLNFTPVKIERACCFPNTNVVYHNHHNAYTSYSGTPRSPQNPALVAKQMIPRDIPGILDFPRRRNYLWPICQFFTVCLWAERKAASDIAQARPTNVLTTKILNVRFGEITLGPFTNIYFRGWLIW